MLDEAFGFFDHHFGDLDVAGGGFVEGRTDHFALDGALHVGDFFGTLIDEENDEGDVGMIGGNGVGDGLEEHRLAGTGRSDDKAALALADRHQQVHDAAGEIVLGDFELDALLGVERSEVIEEDLVTRFFGRLKIDRVYLYKSEIAFAFLRRTDLAGDGVTRSQVKAANLRGGDVDVIGTREVVVLRRAEEAEAIGEALQDVFGEDETGFFGLALQDFEDQFLFTQTGDADDAKFFDDRVELDDRHVLKLNQIERTVAAGAGEIGGFG